MMCASRNELIPASRKRISHAIAYCETFADSDIGERNEIDILKGTGVSPNTAVTILKQSLSQREIPGRHIIMREMDRPEFLSYLAQKLGYDE
jgi:hypothetical protein